MTGSDTILLSALAEIVGKAQVLTEPSDLVGYRIDGRGEGGADVENRFAG